RSLHLQVEGDFDIAVEYEDLQSMVAPGGEGDIQLEVIFADSVETDFRLYRKHHHRQNGRHDQVVSVGFFQQLEKHTHRAWHGQLAEEGTSGRLRIVRRDDQIFFLHASGDSPNDRLVHRQEVTTAPVRFGGVKLVAESHEETVTSVVWKRVTVRSEHPTGFDERDAVTVEQLDEQRVKLPQGRHHEFNQQTPPDQFRSWGDPAHILKQQHGWLVKQPGTEE